MPALQDNDVSLRNFRSSVFANSNWSCLFNFCSRSSLKSATDLPDGAADSRCMTLCAHCTCILTMCLRQLSTSDWKQESQLSLTNRTTHLSKWNDVADLTSVIKIRLKKLIPRIRPFKVTQGHWNRHGSIRHLWFPISLVFYSNFVRKTRRFWDIRLQKCRDLENRVRSPSRSLEI